MPADKATLLIVEDDVDVAEMLSAYFRAQGYQAFAVNWGGDAVQACRSSRPDLVILDIRLPDIDGFEVARRLRSIRRTKNIPIIFLTEKRSRNARLKGLELGADDYITKPFDIQELRLRVRNALRRNSQSALTNPVTGLPEGALVEERLAECLESQDWALVLVVLENLDGFRETYGFVASDDVTRAVSLMVHNAMRELGGTGDFIGQWGTAGFLLFTQPERTSAILERIQKRLEQSLDYFYPLKDREKMSSSRRRIKIRIVQVSSRDGPFADLDALKAALRR